MSTAPTKPAKTVVNPSVIAAEAKKPAETKGTPAKTVKKPLVTAKAVPAVKPAELPVESRIPPFIVKKKKGDKKKVIRDSFSFPEQDYHKISELKKICLAAGVHVKKGEILRAGLNLLTGLKLSELLLAVDKVERVQTGRPKKEKN